MIMIVKCQIAVTVRSSLFRWSRFFGGPLCREKRGEAVERIVQSLNSPFFPPHIGAEPGRAKEESRITCMRMLRTPPFFPPNRGKNHIWKYFPDLACGAIF